MQIGDKVSFIRHNETGVHEGSAILTGIGLDGEKRVIVLLRDGEAAFNTFMTCVNPSPEFCAGFRQMIEEIETLAKYGNAKLKAITDQCNADITALRDALLGEPIKIDNGTPAPSNDDLTLTEEKP